MKNRRSATNAIWRQIRPRLEGLGYEQAGFWMRRVRGGEIADTISGSVNWYTKHGEFQPSASVDLRSIAELLAQHGSAAVRSPDDWRGLGQPFWQWGILEPERFYFGRGKFAFRAGVDADQVADAFWAFYLRVIEPRLQAVHGPGDILRLDATDVGPYPLWEPTAAAAAHLAGNDALARAFLEVAMSGYAVAKERGFRGMDPAHPGWPVACSLLRALGGDPGNLPKQPQPEWPVKDPRFIAKVREGKRPPEWRTYE